LITGTLARSDRLYGRAVKLQAKYVARWAQQFLGLGDDIVTDIPVGDAVYLPADGRFRLSVPNLSQDPLAGAPDHSGELQIWARDKTSEDMVAQLIPVKALDDDDTDGPPENTERVSFGNCLRTV
jgi:hypothetical protein